MNIIDNRKGNRKASTCAIGDIIEILCTGYNSRYIVINSLSDDPDKSIRIMDLNYPAHQYKIHTNTSIVKLNCSLVIED